MGLWKLCVKGLKNPIISVSFASRVLKGFYYKIKFRIINPRVTIGRGFRVKGKLIIRGPGKVVIGNNVFCDGTTHPVTPWTHRRDAVIAIGDNVFLNGTRFGCSTRIDVGDDSVLADCHILDTDHHSILPSRRHDSDAIKSAPITIGRNVWVALDSLILKGVSIGDNSSIGAKSVVISDVPECVVYAGNPAVFIKSVPET